MRIVHALIVVLTQMFFNSMGFLVIAPALVPRGAPFAGSQGEFLLVGIVAAFGAFNVGVGLCHLGRVTLADLGWVKGGAGDVLWGVLGFAACAAVLVGVTAIEGGSEGLRELAGAMRGYSPQSRLLFLAIGLSAAGYEESIFRGYLQPALAARLGPVTGVVATAAIFSAYHLQLNPVALAAKLAIGLVLGTLRSTRGSLLSPAIGHSLIWIVIGNA